MMRAPFRRMIMMLGGQKNNIPTTAEIATGLIGYWKMDESSDGSEAVARTDSSGNNHHASVDTAKCASGTGKVGNGVAMASASSQFLAAADHADLRTGDRDWYWACWVRLTNKTAQQTILAKWNSTGNKREFNLIYDNTADRFQMYVCATGQSPYTLVKADNFGAPSQATWYFVECGFDSVNNLSIINVNRVGRNTAEHTATIYSGDSYVGFGALVDSAGGAISVFLNGILDEVWRWNAIPSAKVLDYIYNGGLGRSLGPFDGSGLPALISGDFLYSSSIGV